MERCPVCRARLKQTPECRRCGSDLTLPLEICHQAGSLFTQSVKRFQQGNLQGALEAIELAIQLKHQSLFVAWRGFVKRSCDV